MSKTHEPNSSNSPQTIELIDSFCDRFETEWAAGAQPRLEAFLSDVAADLRSSLFAALLPVELELRRKAGELPDATSYRQRFPQFETAISKAFQQREATLRTGSPSAANTSGANTSTNTSANPKSQTSSATGPGVAATWPVGRPCENVADFQQALAASGIVPHEQLAEFVSANHAALLTDDISKWAKRLIKAELLTAYQAKVVYSGKGKSLTMGSYTVLDKLGQGGMGLVLKAEHRVMKRVVALKMLSPSVTKTKEAVQRFQREVEAAARLIHPNIVSAFDAGEANGTNFLVMEYVPGDDLSSFVKQQGPLPVEQAIDCITQAARGLEYAHKRGQKSEKSVKIV